MKLKNNVSTIVLQTLSQCEKRIQKWEQTFVIEHMRFLTKEDICQHPSILKLCEQKHIALELLQHWKINAHLFTSLHL